MNRTQCNEVLIFADHIEIFNPGAFPEGYEVEDFTSREQRPVPRNPLIARILYYMGCTDGIGNGLQKVSDVYFKKNEKMILTYLETHDWLTNAAAREIVHVGTTAARSLLNGLVDRGYLRAEGENRGRKYYLAAKRPR